MNVKLDTLEKNVVQLEIEVDAAQFEQGMQKSFAKNANRFSVPGFRKGKAPRKMVERTYGVEALYEDAINFVCEETYDQAVEQTGIHPIDKPEIDIKEIGAGSNFVYIAKVVVKPEVKLGEYKGVEVEKIEVTVTDEEVENALKEVVEKNARLVTVEDRPVATGDTALIDFEGFIDGVAFDGGKGESFGLVIGSGQFIPGFEDQIIGANKGDELDVTVSFPEDYTSEQLAGKPAVFKVKVNEIKVKEMPVVDDEFAKDVSEFDTLEAYKESLKNKMTEQAEHKAKHQMEDKVIDKIIENSTIDVPEVMVNRQVESMVRDFDMRLRYQGIELQQYMEMMGMEMNSFKEQFKERATKEVKSQLVLEKISILENVEASEEELDKEIFRFADEYKQNGETFKKNLKTEDVKYIKDSIAITKTIAWLVENAKIV